MAGEEIGVANFQVRAHANVGLVRAEADHRVDSQLLDLRWNTAAEMVGARQPNLQLFAVIEEETTQEGAFQS